MRTWAMIHNALSRNEVSAQIMDIKYISHATKSSTESSRVTIQSNRFSKETSNDVGSPSKPNLSFMDWSHKFYYFGIVKIHYYLYEIKRTRRLFENQSGIKIVWEKTRFLKFIKIGVSNIIWKLDIRKLNLRIGISEIKFERNWNFENYLRIWNFKKLNYENWDFGN